eukprot:UN3356
MVRSGLILERYGAPLVVDMNEATAATAQEKHQRNSWSEISVAWNSTAEHDRAALVLHVLMQLHYVMPVLQKL